MASHKAGENCICSVCECGRHKICQPRSTADAPLDGHSVYHDDYPKYAVGPRERGRPAAGQLGLPRGGFDGSTETRDQYHSHPVPPPPQPHRTQYVPTNTTFESQTTQKLSYPAWPGVAPPARREPQKWVGGGGKFEDHTTMKDSYQKYTNVGEVGRRIRAGEWVKPETKFEGNTTQSDDYRSWPVQPRYERQAPPFIAPADDRDFKSTASSTYVNAGPAAHAQPIIPRTNLHTEPAKFDGSTTTHDSYQKWNVGPREQRKRELWVPRNEKMEGDTTYKTTYLPTHPTPPAPPPPHHLPPSLPFEGISTTRSAYIAPSGAERAPNFAPRTRYVAHGDDRDFVSTSRALYTPKERSHCPAADWADDKRMRDKDGHVYLKPEWSGKERTLHVGA